MGEGDKWGRKGAEGRERHGEGRGEEGERLGEGEKWGRKGEGGRELWGGSEGGRLGGREGGRGGGRDGGWREGWGVRGEGWRGDRPG